MCGLRDPLTSLAEKALSINPNIEGIWSPYVQEANTRKYNSQVKLGLLFIIIIDNQKWLAPMYPIAIECALGIDW